MENQFYVVSMDRNNTITCQVISSISHVFYIIKQNIFKKNGIKKIKNPNRIQKIQNISNRTIPRFYAKKDEFESNGLITTSLKR